MILREILFYLLKVLVLLNLWWNKLKQKLSSFPLCASMLITKRVEGRKSARSIVHTEIIFKNSFCAPKTMNIGVSQAKTFRCWTHP